VNLSAIERPSEIPPGKDAVSRVLVVDDEPTLRRSLARLLASRGMQVTTADDGVAALEILAQQPFEVALSTS
jgi:CheY-like chemotaxis protein